MLDPYEVKVTVSLNEVHDIRIMWPKVPLDTPQEISDKIGLRNQS